MSTMYSAATANKFPKAKPASTPAGKVGGISCPSPQFSQLSGVKPAKGGSAKSASPTVGYHRANC